MSKCPKAKVDELVARECHHVYEKKIHNIRAAMEVQL